MEMIKKRYISVLIPLKEKQIIQGIEEIQSKHRSMLRFKDKLICTIL